MTASKKCIAIIPSIEGWHLLQRLLPTIDLPKEHIFIIDQGSQDGTEQKCQDLGYGCIQMHTRATFTEAVNRGIKEALDRNADYVLILNNDIEFLTPVASQLMKRAETEAQAGVIAPRQIVVMEHKKKRHDIQRGTWQLSTLDFSHDYEVARGYDSNEDVTVAKIHPELLEADFCEFTCVLIKNVVFKSVGLLDEKYQFYHEDADFCFRCQEVGFRCIYDQTALIKHYPGSTFEKQTIFDRKKLIRRNKSHFAKDHLRHFVRFFYPSPTTACSWSMTNEFLWRYLKKYGLMTSHPNAPRLSNLSHPHLVVSDYLITVWETSKIPQFWINECKKFKHIFVPSHWNKQVFKDAGIANISLFPFGIEPDVFHPWGPRLSFPWDKSVLCVFQSQYRKALDVTLQMWGHIHKRHPNTFLVVYGKGIDTSNLKIDDCVGSRMGNFMAQIDENRQIALLQPSFHDYVGHVDLATLYRSCEIYLLNSRSEGFGYPILEAMACGTLCVIPNYGAAKEFIKDDNCIFFEGTPTEVNYKDRGFEDVGEWWEPDLDTLCTKVNHALFLDSKTAAEIAHRGRQSVLSTYTWRHSMMALRKNLQQLQPADDLYAYKKRDSLKFKKHTSFMMQSMGRRLLKASRAMESDGLMGVAKQIKANFH